MQKNYYSYRTADKIRKRFGSHDVLHGKANPKFPESAEREYKRLMNLIMKEFKKTLEEELPKLKDEYRKQWEEQEMFKADGLPDLNRFLSGFFDGIFVRFTQKLEAFDVSRQLLKVAGLTKKQEIREWKRQVRQTLGVNLSEDYYSGEFFDDLISQWVSENVDLIKTIPKDTLGRMKEVVKDGYLKGTSTSEIMRQIQEAYGIEKRHARFIALDQMSKLNAKITQKEHEDAGVTSYEWSDSGDRRVRESHRRLNGQVFEYANPPVTDDGRRCNPGEDYRCRCVALPIFDFENLSLPIEDENNDY